MSNSKQTTTAEDGLSTLRMNFTAADPETIGRAVSIIGEVIAEELGGRV